MSTVVPVYVFGDVNVVVLPLSRWKLMFPAMLDGTTAEAFCVTRNVAGVAELFVIVPYVPGRADVPATPFEVRMLTR